MNIVDSDLQSIEPYEGVCRRFYGEPFIPNLIQAPALSSSSSSLLLNSAALQRQSDYHISREFPTAVTLLCLELSHGPHVFHIRPLRMWVFSETFPPTWPTDFELEFTRFAKLLIYQD